MAHGVEGEKVIFSDAIRLAEELEAGFEDAGFGVLEGDTDTEHRTAVVMVEINAFGDFAPGDTEEDGAAAVTTSCAIGFEGERSFLRVWGFDKDEFEFPDLVKDPHALPHGDDGLHVEVGREENDDAIGGDFGEFHEEATVVADDARFVTDLEAGGDSGLIGATGDDHG